MSALVLEKHRGPRYADAYKGTCIVTILIGKKFSVRYILFSEDVHVGIVKNRSTFSRCIQKDVYCHHVDWKTV